MHRTAQPTMSTSSFLNFHISLSFPTFFNVDDLSCDISKFIIKMINVSFANFHYSSFDSHPSFPLLALALRIPSFKCWDPKVASPMRSFICESFRIANQFRDFTTDRAKKRRTINDANSNRILKIFIYSFYVLFFLFKFIEIRVMCKPR